MKQAIKYLRVRTIKDEDLSKIYVRVECQGLDKHNKEHPLPLNLQSQTFMTLEEALVNNENIHTPEIGKLSFRWAGSFGSAFPLFWIVLSAIML